MSIGGPIPDKDEIARDLIKWFFGKYGAAAWDAFWSTPQPVQDLLDKARDQKQLTSGSGGDGGGLAIAAIAALALTSSRRTKRGRKKRR